MYAKSKTHVGFNHKSNASTASPSARNGWVEGRLQLELKTVIGTTATSANAFDINSELSLFVYCAGSAVVLSHVDEDHSISPRFLRARPDILPINPSQSFYNASTPSNSPSKIRHGSPFKAAAFATRDSIPSEHTPDTGNHTWSTSRAREATCVAVSRSGNLVVVGEVGSPTINPSLLLLTLSRQATTLGFFCFLQFQTLHLMFLYQS